MGQAVRCVNVLLVVLNITAAGTGSDYDIAITSGQIYDGSGQAPYVADVGIKGDRIVTIGRLQSDAETVINAQGLVVCPGFIDIHTHAVFSKQERKPEETEGINFDEIKAAKNYLFQGVTSIVSGNCGVGDHRVADIFQHIRQTGAGVNVLELVGHETVREAVMGMAERDPTGTEMERMKGLVRQAMEAGAVGISTGLYYPPGHYAKTEEIIELARVVHEYEGTYATHIRDEGAGLLDGIREAIRIGDEARVPVQISHLKVFGVHGEGKAAAATRLIEAAQSEGLTVYADQYPYVAASTHLAPLVLRPWVSAGGRSNMLNRLANRTLWRRIHQEVTEKLKEVGGPQAIRIAFFREQKRFEGQTLAQISRTMRASPTTAALRILQTDNPQVVVFAMQEADVQHFMRKPYVMTGSDGWNLPFGQGVCHPRNYGTFVRKIRRYVLEKKVITMEQAIRAATSLPADMLGLTNRGRIKQGFAADIVVFDPKTIRDLASYEKPHQYPEGLEYLLVNGVLTINKGRYTGALPGRPLPASRAEAPARTGAGGP